MARNYKLLTDDDKDEIMAQFLLAQERDIYCHEVNVVRFEKMIAKLKERDDFDEIKNKQFYKLLERNTSDTKDRIVEIEAIIECSDKDMPSIERMKKAMERVKAKAGR